MNTTARKNINHINLTSDTFTATSALLSRAERENDIAGYPASVISFTDLTAPLDAFVSRNYLRNAVHDAVESGEAVAILSGNKSYVFNGIAWIVGDRY